MAEHQLRDTDEAVDEEPVKTEETVETGEPTSESATDKPKETEAKAGDAKADASSDSDDKDSDDDLDDEEYGLSMDKVEAVLNQSVDKKHMTPQMRRIIQRQEENTRRVEETIKGTKANPRWFVPLFVTLMLLGLIWIVVYYISSTRGNVYPIPTIGNWNLAVGFGILLVGFLMTMWWH